MQLDRVCVEVEVEVARLDELGHVRLQQCCGVRAHQQPQEHERLDAQVRRGLVAARTAQTRATRVHSNGEHKPR